MICRDKKGVLSYYMIGIKNEKEIGFASKKFEKESQFEMVIKGVHIVRRSR